MQDVYYIEEVDQAMALLKPILTGNTATAR